MQHIIDNLELALRHCLVELKHADEFMGLDRRGPRHNCIADAEAALRDLDVQEGIDSKAIRKLAALLGEGEAGFAQERAL